MRGVLVRVSDRGLLLGPSGSPFSLRAVSPFSGRDFLARCKMGRHKKVPSRSAGVEKKFEKKILGGESSSDPGGSKAHVPALLEAPGRLVRGAESLGSRGRLVRKSGPGPSRYYSGLGIFGVRDLSKFGKD